MCQAKKSARPPKRAPSATRSSVESRKAPKSSLRPDLARHRAVDEVAEDERGDDQDALPHQPLGKKTSAPKLTPRVPTSVTTSGLMPSRMKRLMKGASMTPCQNCLNRSSTARRLPVQQGGPDVRHRRGRPG